MTSSISTLVDSWNTNTNTNTNTDTNTNTNTNTTNTTTTTTTTTINNNNNNNNHHHQGFFSKKMFRGTLSLTQENHHFIVQIRKNKCSNIYGVGLVGIPTFKIFTFAR